MTTLFIKNMVCNRCIMVVKNDLAVTNIKLGEITLANQLTSNENEVLGKALIPLGFEIIDDKKGRIIEKIKNIIIELVHHQNNDTRTNLSDVLSSKLNHDYNYL
ncbi:MAG: AraC family transcriptional regulator, partial [Sphingobacterium sp.]